MNVIEELEKSMRKNSFEDSDQSLNNFPYMGGYLQSTKNEKIMIYRWDEKEHKNKRVWVAKDEL